MNSRSTLYYARGEDFYGQFFYTKDKILSNITTKPIFSLQSLYSYPMNMDLELNTIIFTFSLPTT